MLQKLLKKYLGDDAKVVEFINEMKENKIYLSKEENMDTRYPKLKNDYEALLAKDGQSQALIEELKANNVANADLQAKIGEYEKKVTELEQEKQKMSIDNQVKLGLLAKGAKANDIDYLMYRIENGDTELKLDKDGNVKGLDALIEDMAKAYSGNFEDKSKKKVDVADLGKDEGDKDTVTKEAFAKMTYQQRNELYQQNQELYEQLSKGE